MIFKSSSISLHKTMTRCSHIKSKINKNLLNNHHGVRSCYVTKYQLRTVEWGRRNTFKIYKQSRSNWSINFNKPKSKSIGQSKNSTLSSQKTSKMTVSIMIKNTLIKN